MPKCDDCGANSPTQPYYMKVLGVWPNYCKKCYSKDRPTTIHMHMFMHGDEYYIIDPYAKCTGKYAFDTSKGVVKRNNNPFAKTIVASTVDIGYGISQSAIDYFDDVDLPYIDVYAINGDCIHDGNLVVHVLNMDHGGKVYVDDLFTFLADYGITMGELREFMSNIEHDNSGRSNFVNICIANNKSVGC